MGKTAKEVIREVLLDETVFKDVVGRFLKGSTADTTDKIVEALERNGFLVTRREFPFSSNDGG